MRSARKNKVPAEKGNACSADRCSAVSRSPRRTQVRRTHARTYVRTHACMHARTHARTHVASRYCEKPSVARVKPRARLDARMEMARSCYCMEMDTSPLIAAEATTVTSWLSSCLPTDSVMSLSGKRQASFRTLQKRTYKTRSFFKRHLTNINFNYWSLNYKWLALFKN